MHKIITTFLITFTCFSVTGKQADPLPISQCVDEAPYGLPLVSKSDTNTICRQGYVLEHDNKAKIPMWVSYTLKPEEAVGCNNRDSAFSSDKSIPVGKRSEEKDYAKSGYDTGHLANDGDFRWSLQAARESFILSNMVPQLPGFNRGIWKRLEDQTRGWAISRKHELLIYVGPIYDRKQDQTIGKGTVTVPHSFYKIIVDTTTNEAMIFILPHESSNEDLETFMSSLAEVQKETGIVFPMPKDVKIADEPWKVVMKTAVKSKRSICSVK